MGNLARYHPDDVIRLALGNRGYGFRRFMEQLFGSKSKNESQILRLFEIHKHETGVNPFEVLQDPSLTKMVTHNEYMKITGRRYAPKGHGRRGNTAGKKANLDATQGGIPLHPQDFDWLDVAEIPEEEREEWRGVTNHIFLMNYPLVLELHDEKMMTYLQISEQTGHSEKMIEKFFEKLVQYDRDDVANDWVRVLSFLWRVQVERGGDHFQDELMMDIRGIFKDYVNDPVNVEPPTDGDLHWVYNQLLSEEE